MRSGSPIGIHAFVVETVVIRGHAGKNLVSGGHPHGAVAFVFNKPVRGLYGAIGGGGPYRNGTSCRAIVNRIPSRRAFCEDCHTMA